MGYYINSCGSNFKMSKANANAAMEAIKNLFSRPNYRAGWVTSKNVLNANTFEDALFETMFSVDGTGDYYDYIWFEGEKYSGNEIDVLNAISPYIEDGSYIEMQGEEGERWRWIFHKDGVEEKYAKLVWEDEGRSDMDKNTLRIKGEAIVSAFERYCDTLQAEQYEAFYDAVNDLLALGDD